MAEYGVDYLSRLLEAVGDFEVAFDAWMGTQVESDHLSARGIFPTAWVKDGQDDAEVRKLELVVAETAGRAASAVAVTGAYIAVQGRGTIDPISNWWLVQSPKAPLSPRDIRATAASVRGRLRAKIVDAEARADSDLPAFSPAQLHPVVWSAAAVHWTTHQRRVAVREAAEGLTIHWKQRLDRHDVDDTVFWQQTLSPGDPVPGKPKLVWPGPPDAKTSKSMRGGLEPMAKALVQLATGANLTIRNVTTHMPDELSEQEAMERLSTYSYLARLLDKCQVARVDEESLEDQA
ncbi:TIGR02391 family protein [Promicromonospora sp. NFX87]|uniref:TIGR02391 family protein n=1 Tax=Promicromonospora sp. NFX87 TaxID=3402691 RepID=UPI003AFB3C6A